MPVQNRAETGVSPHPQTIGYRPGAGSFPLKPTKKDGPRNRAVRLDPCLKVTELAMMSGFRNGVTFNLAFKLFVGLPPSEWCRQCRERPAAEAHDPVAPGEKQSK